jgi:FAD synthetase
MNSKSRRLVMGFGTFDALHPGHLFYLNELKKLGDELVVVIARDSNVEKIKGKLPHLDEEIRRRAVLDTGVPDEVVLGDEKDFYKVLRDFKPSILGFGYDQKADIEALKKLFPKIEMVRLEAHHPHKYKSSLIREGKKLR